MKFLLQRSMQDMALKGIVIVLLQKKIVLLLYKFQQIAFCNEYVYPLCVAKRFCFSIPYDQVYIDSFKNHCIDLETRRHFINASAMFQNICYTQNNKT